MYNSAKKGWYTVLNTSKVLKPLDEHMKSFKFENDNILLNYKSSLEFKAFKYADFNKHIVKFGVEPFPIKYLKPQDGKIHRYYIDMFLEFDTGHKILVEIKSSSETVPPKKPKKVSTKSSANYQRALMTYSVNQAKWVTARQFAKDNNMTFCILTEKELG